VKQWDIFSYAFREGDHPAVVLSADEIAENPDIEDVNVLFAATCRPIARPPKRHEVMLDERDGLDWKTAVRCHQLVLLRKADLRNHRGVISKTRRREIARKIVEVFRLPIA
jgi:mRNA-degrading endonuclease toxin of MazEF toxin-antitoxin module